MDHSTDVHEGPNDSSCVEPKVVRDCWIIFPALKYIGRSGCCIGCSQHHYTSGSHAVSHPYQYPISNILGLFIQSCILEGQTPKEGLIIEHGPEQLSRRNS